MLCLVYYLVLPFLCVAVAPKGTTSTSAFSWLMRTFRTARTNEEGFERRERRHPRPTTRYGSAVFASFSKLLLRDNNTSAASLCNILCLQKTLLILQKQERWIWLFSGSFNDENIDSKKSPSYHFFDCHIDGEITEWGQWTFEKGVGGW